MHCSVQAEWTSDNIVQADKSLFLLFSFHLVIMLKGVICHTENLIGVLEFVFVK